MTTTPHPAASAEVAELVRELRDRARDFLAASRPHAQNQAVIYYANRLGDALDAYDAARLRPPSPPEPEPGAGDLEAMAREWLRQCGDSYWRPDEQRAQLTALLRRVSVRAAAPDQPREDDVAAIAALEDLASQLYANGVHVGPCIEFGARIRRHLDSLRPPAPAGRGRDA